MPSFRDDGPIEDRMSHQGTTIVYRPVLVEAKDITGFCLWRNISSEGMKGRFFIEFADNTHVSVQFSADMTSRGKVNWSREGMIGIQFDAPVDGGQTLLRLGNSTVKGQSHQAPRLKIQTAVQIMLDGRRLEVETQDTSQNRRKVCISSLRHDQEGTVVLGGMAPKKAVVSWTKGQLAGLSFGQPLAFDEMGEWVIQRCYASTPALAKSTGQVTDAEIAFGMGLI